jgi:hypothetical protein
LSKLIDYFEYNHKFTTSQHILYQNFPLKHVWKENEGWLIQQKDRSVDCMYNCSPIAREQFYLQLLLTAVPRAWSFTDLFYFESVQYPIYCKACFIQGLAEDNAE